MFEPPGTKVLEEVPRWKSMPQPVPGGKNTPRPVPGGRNTPLPGVRQTIRGRDKESLVDAPSEHHQAPLQGRDGGVRISTCYTGS